MNIVEATLGLIAMLAASIALIIGAIFGSGGEAMMVAGLACLCVSPVAFIAYFFSNAWQSKANLWRPTGQGRTFQITAVLAITLGAAGSTAALI